MKNNKNVMIAVIVIVVLIVGFTLWRVLVRTGNTQNQTEQVLQNEPTIAPVDKNVKVELTEALAGKEVLLTVDKIPSGTKLIEYQLSYEEKTKGLQGAIGEVEVNGDSEIKKKITLGTCSSGTCVYHNVVGSILLELKFSGSYGERKFEKEYTL